MRRPATSLRPPSLSEEVERILSSHKGPVSLAPRTTPTPTSYRSSQPSIERTSQPSLETSPASERPSDVQRVAAEYFIAERRTTGYARSVNQPGVRP